MDTTQDQIDSNVLPKKKSSYREVAPLERGGVIARQGFNFQDHIAALFCLEMLEQGGHTEVWCETHDDITLIHANEVGEEFEFVQVKNERPKSPWSIASLCDAEKEMSDGKRVNKIGSSIVEKLLANDRGQESCKFRIVTSFPTNDELKLLRLPIDSPTRRLDSTAFTEMIDSFRVRVGKFLSPNGNDIQFLLERCFCQEHQSEDVVRENCLLKLMRFAQAKGLHLAPDQAEETYRKVLVLVQDAAKIDYSINRQAKQITRIEFELQITDLITYANNPNSEGKGNRLRGKMADAQLPDDYFADAQELRRDYLKKSRRGGYLEITQRENIEAVARASLLELKTELDAGTIVDSGLLFHKACLDKLKEVSQKMSPNDEHLNPFLKGFMYEQTDRCVHRFMKVTR